MFYLNKNPLIVRKISSTPKKEIFLTFDDGPDPTQTPKILDLLKKINFQASFFVIGEKARQNQHLIRRMIHEGHSVMSHSHDHSYSHYFHGKKKLKAWLQNSLESLSELTGQDQRVFRPPAGILTPHLVWAARELKVPLVLWNQRFYDSAHALTEKKVRAYSDRSRPGDIILLHDRQPLKYQAVFLSSLELLARKAQALGFQGGTLTNELIFQEIQGRPSFPGSVNCHTEASF